MDRLTLPDCANNTSFDAGAYRGVPQRNLRTQPCMLGSCAGLHATAVVAKPLAQKSMALCVNQSLRKLSWQPLQVPPVAAKAVLILSKLPVLAAALSLVASA